MIVLFTLSLELALLALLIEHNYNSTIVQYKLFIFLSFIAKTTLDAIIKVISVCPSVTSLYPPQKDRNINQ